MRAVLHQPEQHVGEAEHGVHRRAVRPGHRRQGEEGAEDVARPVDQDEALGRLLAHGARLAQPPAAGNLVRRDGRSSDDWRRGAVASMRPASALPADRLLLPLPRRRPRIAGHRSCSRRRQGLLLRRRARGAEDRERRQVRPGRDDRGPPDPAAGHRGDGDRSRPRPSRSRSRSTTAARSSTGATSTCPRVRPRSSASPRKGVADVRIEATKAQVEQAIDTRQGGARRSQRQLDAARGAAAAEGTPQPEVAPLAAPAP